MYKTKSIRTLFIITSSSLVFLFIALAFSAWFSERRLFNATPLYALAEWPGHLPQKDIDEAYVWQQQEISGGIVYLYYYPLRLPETPPNSYCVGATFVAPDKSGSWRSQSGNKLGCWQVEAGFDRLTPSQITSGKVYPVSLPHHAPGTPSSFFMATVLPGGNITPLTVAYGLAQQGQRVRIQWADGLVTYAGIHNGTFIDANPTFAQVSSVDLIDENGRILASKTWPVMEEIK